jgi:hypothetical protein
LLERSGASVKPTNRAPPFIGARITIRWPRPAFEQGRRTSRTLDQTLKISAKMAGTG